MKPTHSLLGLLLALLPAVNVLAAQSAQDPDISVTPVVRQFPVTVIGTPSTPAVFTITNRSSGSLSLGTIEMAGTNPTEFEIASTDCPAALTAGADCTVSVDFKPASTGTKSAYLRIPFGSSAKILSAFLTNSAGAVAEAQERMPPVLSAVNIPETMTAGTLYDLSWTLEGYNDSYTSYAVMFDCTGISDGSCGNAYGDTTRFAESTVLDPTTTTAGNWQYSGVTSKAFTYHWSFNPDTRSGGAPFAVTPGTDVVVRFYLKSNIDTARGSASVSLLIPGNQASSYYDTAGRRIVKKIKAP